MNYPPNNPMPNNDPEPPRPVPPGYVRIPLHQPFVTYILLVINVAVWLLLEVTGGSTSAANLLRFGANSGWYVINQGEFWRLFTSMFLHIGFAHLAFNGYALFIFGIEMERIYDPARFTTIYILSGLFGSLLSVARGPTVLSAGASGAIFGVIGMNLAYFLTHRESFGTFGRQRITSTLMIIGINLIFGFTIPGIDNLAHLGGLISGFALGYGLAPRYQIANQFTLDQRLIDTNSLLKRWWIPAFAIAVLVGGMQLILAFWQPGIGG